MFSKTTTALEQFDNQHDFERMAADILNAIGYTEVIPIAPRGGSDEGKDITFTTESGGKGLACVTLRDDIQHKFDEDFKKRKADEYERYILFCTANLTALKKRKFAKYCLDTLEADFVPYDIEALRSLLDNPFKSIRERYLHIKDDSKGITEETLAARLDEIERKNQALILFSKAENATSLVECEKFICEALQKYPDLPGARRFLGLRLSNEVQTHFSYLLNPGSFPQRSQRSTQSPSLAAITYYTYASMGYGQISQLLPEPPKLEAIDWLQQALQHQDNPEGEVSAALALMYGFTEAYGKMISALRVTLTSYPGLVSYFQLPEHLLMVIHACTTLASIEEVMHVLSMKLPKIDEVQQVLRETADSKRNPNAFAQPYIEWYAVKSKMGIISKVPVTVRIPFPTKNGLTYAQVSPLSHVSTIIPKQTSTTGIIDTLILVEDILKQLADIGIVLITLT